MGRYRNYRQLNGECGCGKWCEVEHQFKDPFHLLIDSFSCLYTQGIKSTHAYLSMSFDSALEILPRNSDYVSVALLWWLPLSEIWRNGEKCFPSRISREPFATFVSRLCAIGFVLCSQHTVFLRVTFLHICSYHLSPLSAAVPHLCMLSWYISLGWAEVLCGLHSHSQGSESFKSNIVGPVPVVLREDCSTRVTLLGEMCPEKL